MARVLIREAHGGATRVVSDRALPYFQNSGWVVVDTLDDTTDASPLYLSKAESDFRYAKLGDLGNPASPAGAAVRAAVGVGVKTYPTRIAAEAGLAAGEFTDGALILITGP